MMSLSTILACALLQQPAAAQEPARPKDLYVVGYAHLDTQWRWTYPQTIREYLANTLHDNFALFEKYPGYVFNFIGLAALPDDQGVLPRGVRAAEEVRRCGPLVPVPAPRWTRTTPTRPRPSR